MQKPLSYIICFSAALMLTFGRTGLVPFVDLTLPDMAMNVVVVVLAPLCIFLIADWAETDKILLTFVPVILLVTDVACGILLNSPTASWPDHSTLLSIGLAIFLSSSIRNGQLRRLRWMVLLVAALFNLFLFVYARDAIAGILSGGLHIRFGADVSPGLLVSYPRKLYVLVFTCVATALIEENLFLRLGVMAMTPLPLLVGLATGGRGAMVALAAATFAFLAVQRKKSMVLAGVVIAGGVVLLGGYFIDHYLSVTAQRMENFDSDSGRSDIHAEALEQITVFGRGIGQTYAHNVFLEFFRDYGLVGLALFLGFLLMIFVWLLRVFKSTRSDEIRWMFGLIVLQLTAQQFSLNIFTDMFWAALALPIGLHLSRPEKGAESASWMREPYAWSKFSRRNN